MEYKVTASSPVTIQINPPPRDGRCECCGISARIAPVFNNGQRDILKDWRDMAGGGCLSAYWCCRTCINLSDAAFWARFSRRWDHETGLRLRHPEVPDDIYRQSLVWMASFVDVGDWPEDRETELGDGWTLRLYQRDGFAWGELYQSQAADTRYPIEMHAVGEEKVNGR